MARPVEHLMARPPLVLIDGDCGFCTSMARALDRLLHLHATTVAWQAADLDGITLTSGEASSAVWFVDAGRRCSGAPAVAAWLGTGPPPVRWVGAILQAPGVRVVASMVYRVVARHRARIPGPWQHTCAPVKR